MLELLSLRKATTLTKDIFLGHLYGGMDEPEFKIIDVFICCARSSAWHVAVTIISRPSGAVAMSCAIRMTRIWPWLPDLFLTNPNQAHPRVEEGYVVSRDSDISLALRLAWAHDKRMSRLRAKAGIACSKEIA